MFSNDQTFGFAATGAAFFVEVADPSEVLFHNSGPAKIYLFAGNSTVGEPSTPPSPIVPSAPDPSQAIPLASGARLPLPVKRGIWVFGDPDASDVTLTESDTGTRVGKAWVRCMALVG